MTQSIGMIAKSMGRFVTDFARQLVTNHLLHFIQLDRSDPKKFQVLQIMASLLNWTDGLFLI